MKEHGMAQKGITLVFGLAILILYILHFTSGDDITVHPDTDAPDDVPGHMVQKIAYVDTDSLLSQYEMVKVLEDQLQKEGEGMRRELERRERNLQQRAMQYQQRVQNNEISIEEATRTEEALMQEQEALMRLQQEYASQFADQSLILNQELVDTVSGFLGRYNKTKHFDFILARSQANNNILFANDTFDITKEVIEQLNYEYNRRMDSQ